jgi:hypothetical protein
LLSERVRVGLLRAGRGVLTKERGWKKGWIMCGVQTISGYFFGTLSWRGWFIQIGRTALIPGISGVSLAQGFSFGGGG